MTLPHSDEYYRQTAREIGREYDEPTRVQSSVKLAKSAVLPSGQNVRSAVVTYLSTVAPEPVDWIWPGRLARGKYTLLAGEPGLGKTFLSLDVGSRITRGGLLPDGMRAPIGRVLLLTAEDGIADTIRPRVDDLGGDPSMFAVLEAVKEPDGTRTAVSLVRDLGILAAAVHDVRPTLVIVDPVSAYLGHTDTHRDSEVRAALAPLVDLAEQQGFALLMIGHLSKDAQKAALHRPGGSIAFVAAARLVLALAADPHNPARRLLAAIKSNICRPSSTLAYQITDNRLAWEADAVDMDVEAIFAAGSAGDREDRTDAERVVRELLDDETAWPMEAKRAIEAGQAHSIPDRTMRWTAKKLGIRISRTSGFGAAGKWLWHRPDVIPATTLSMPLNVAAIAALENHSKKEEEVNKSVHRGNALPVFDGRPV